MPRTRNTKATVAEVTAVDDVREAPKLPPADATPQKVFILPKNTSTEARIITLPDPARSRPTRYMVCPERGFFEFTRIAAEPRAQPRSWLIVDDSSTETSRREGYVAKSPDLYVATPFDSLFFLLPLICTKEDVAGDKKALFKVLDDYVDSAQAGQSKFAQLLRDQRYRTLFESRLRTVCDVLEAGDEVMFRLSQEKLTQTMQAKAQRLVAKGLPASMEERFVTRALDVPMSGREHSSAKVKESDVTGKTWRSEITENGSGTVLRTLIEGAEAAPEQPTSTVPAHVLVLLRTRIALLFLLRSYVESHLHTPILASTATLDFTPLDLHLSHITEVRSQAQALRTISNNIGRKRAADEDEPVDFEEVKRQKKEEEDKKKKLQSFGVKALSKVNTKGMKKMSAFFVKKEKT